MNFTLNYIDIAIILASIIMVIVVGLVAAKKQDDSAKGYFLASGRLPWYIIGAAFVSTSVSSEQIVGTVGQAYESGLGIANWEWWSLPVYALMIVFFIPMFMKSKITTVPEFLNRRFGPFCAYFYSLVMLIAYACVFLVVVLYGGSLTFANLTGWNFQLVLWTTIVLVGLYSIKGGLSSVMWTDAVQCVLLVGGGVLLFFIALAQMPGGIAHGWQNMAAATPERFHLYHPPSDPVAPFLAMLLGSAGVFVFYQAANQVMVQRVLGARSTWDGMMGIVFAGFINMLRPLATCFLGLIVWHWTHVLHNAAPLVNKDDTFSFVLKTFSPSWGLRGIVLAGFIAAVMSTISALANSTATIFCLDVYHKLINKEATDKQLVKTGQMAAIVVLIVAGLLAPLVASVGIFQYFQTGVTYLAVPFTTVILFGLLWKRANYQCAIFGLVGGIALLAAVVSLNWTFIYYDTLPHWLCWFKSAANAGHNLYKSVGIPPSGLHWIYQGFVAQVFLAIGMVIVALRYPAPKPEVWEPFQWTPQHLRAYDEGIVRPWYHSMWLWLGVFAVVWLTTYYIFW